MDQYITIGKLSTIKFDIKSSYRLPEVINANERSIQNRLITIQILFFLLLSVTIKL